MENNICSQSMSMLLNCFTQMELQLPLIFKLNNKILPPLFSFFFMWKKCMGLIPKNIHKWIANCVFK